MKRFQSVLWGVLASLVLVVSGCQSPINRVGGTVSIHINKVRTIKPESVVVNYQLSATGPAGESVEQGPQSSTDFALTDVSTGDWTISVNGLDADGNAVAFGSTTLNVAAATTSSASIDLGPVGGTGYVSIASTLDGTSGPVFTGILTKAVVKLTDMWGTETSLAIDVAGTVETNTFALEAGSYLVNLKLRDSADNVAYYVAALQIFKGLTSPVTISLEELNKLSWNYEEPEVVVPDNGFLGGTVYDSTGATLSGVSIKLNDSTDAEVATATTDATGQYLIEAVPGTDYKLTYDLDGYVSVTYSGVEVVAGETTTLQNISLSAKVAESVTGWATGTIVNAFDGSAIAGAQIDVFAGVNNSEGNPVDSFVTDDSGNYVTNALDAGQYTGKITLAGYSTTTFTIDIVGGITTGNQNMAMTPEIAGTEIRIVLTWGATPSDLDSHITTPNGAHVFYGNAVEADGDGVTLTALDHDDVSSFGPETITLYHQESGIYTYYVHNYIDSGVTGGTDLATSGATVQVYMGANLAAEYFVPNQVGNLWKVFQLNGSSLKSINQVLDLGDDAGTVPSRALKANGREASLFSNLPAKR